MPAVPRGTPPLALVVLALVALSPAFARAADPPPLDARRFDVGTSSVRVVRVPPDFPLPTLLGVPARLDVELALGRDGPDLVHVDGAGTPRRFAPRAALGDGRFVHAATDGSDARITGGGPGGGPGGGAGDGPRHALREADGTVVEFVAGAPVRATSPDGRVALWHRAAGRLVRHDDGRGRVLDFDHEAGRLVRVTSGDGALDADALRAVAGAGADAPAGTHTGSWFDECPVDTVCDAAGSPPPDGFLDGPGIPGAVRRDVRPGSCRSHFVDYRGTRRGRAIEHGLIRFEDASLGLPTVPGFPVVDFVGADELVVVRSRDLASPTYDDPVRDALFDRLMRDGLDVERLLLGPLRERGHVEAGAADGVPGIRRIEATPERSVVLELVVRRGMASPSQIDQIERARIELAARHGIELRVVEIP